MSKILVIEDEFAIRDNIIELLEIEDFEVLGAENGRIGFQKASEYLPDLILCDVMMPDLDGYGVLSALRSNPTTATIPFIFLTAKAEHTDIRQGMGLGADDYLTKPCTAEELLEAIKTRLKKQEIFDKQSQLKLDELRRSITHSLPHELRTPLNGILGNTELLLLELDDLDVDEMRKMLEDIRTSGQRLNRLIINFLLYADLELISTNNQRILALQKSSVSSVDTLISNAAKEQARLFNRETDLQLKLQDSPVQMAATRLAKLVEELVNNAFKFSEPGTPVSVKTEVKDNKFVLLISDKGRGMTPEQIEKIGTHLQFERKLYEQQGSGMGLSIVKRLVELHEGKLIIESIPNQQTTVRVELLIAANF
ncbi:response regulator [Lyngbya sp. PCC 8106]|uniref:hybrid sensor histidine kinase/response regulator n=1 Tax=Lyngbya sp. (strain PCC 8106) TaxID=313612 RepID=UPI0000EA8A88|nr:response regulator [Lyngbya sp. PCC 8106]EAW37293.1 Response Regulator Receiver Signal Transduction Histidine Kinase [Lyngbya sp. PCC 8106]